LPRDTESAVELRRLDELEAQAARDPAVQLLLDDIVKIAAEICGTPMAAVTLLGGDRQLLAARVGRLPAEMPRDISFCTHGIDRPGGMVVPDALLDPTFLDNPLVTGPDHVRFYQGAPVEVEDGSTVGMVCVLDTRPRELSPSQVEALGSLSRTAASLLDSRATGERLSAALEQVEVEQTARTLADRRLRWVFDSTPVGLGLIGADGCWAAVNPAMAGLLQRPLQSIPGLPYADTTVTDERAYEEQLVREARAGRLDTLVREQRLLLPDGGTELVQEAWEALRDPDGQLHMLQVRVEAIGARRQAEATLEEAWATVDGIVSIDGGDRILSWSQGAERLLGWTRGQALGRSVTDLIVPPELRQAHSAGVTRVSAGGLRRLVGGAPVTLPAVHRDGSRIMVEVTLAAWQRGGRAGYTAVLRDVTERLAVEAERQHRLTHDSLTGLGNLALLGAQESEVLAAATEAAPVAVAVLDLKRLGGVTEALGHLRGEELLRQVGAQLRQEGESWARVYRLSGGIFAVVQPLAGSPVDGGPIETQLRRLGAEVLDALRGPYRLEGIEVEVEGTAGIAVAPRDGTGADELLRRAAHAVPRSTDRVGTVTGCADGVRASDLVLLAGLRRGIAAGELRLHYQPVLPVPGVQAATSVEALVRWQHPDLGLLPPDSFVPLAEETRTIHALTWWVLDEAVRQQRAWAVGGLDVSIAVNLSARVLGAGSAEDLVAAALRRHDCPPDRITVELTESALVDDPAVAAQTLSALRHLGVGLALDDFGTGFTSLQMLSTLPFDVLKVDRSFVAAVTTRHEDAAIVGSVADLGHRLGLSVIAEGVEDEETLARVAELGCDRVQGYLHSRPLPPDDAHAWLLLHRVRQQQPAVAQVSATLGV